MIAAGNSTMIRDVGQSAAFGDKTFEVVNEFVYLAPLVTPNNDVSLEKREESRLQLNAPLHCANKCSRYISHVQQNSSFTELLHLNI
jgi:hypothetical protein